MTLTLDGLFLRLGQPVPRDHREQGDPNCHIQIQRPEQEHDKNPVEKQSDPKHRLGWQEKQADVRAKTKSHAQRLHVGQDGEGERKRAK